MRNDFFLLLYYQYALGIRASFMILNRVVTGDLGFFSSFDFRILEIILPELGQRSQRSHPPKEKKSKEKHLLLTQMKKILFLPPVGREF